MNTHPELTRTATALSRTPPYPGQFRSWPASYASDARLVAMATPKMPGASTFPAGVTSDPDGPIINVVGMLVVRGNGAVCGWVPIPD